MCEEEVMMKRGLFQKNRALFSFLAAAILAFGAGGLQGQEIARTIDLDDGDSIPDFSFGMELSQDGTTLAVTICGDIFAPNNHRIVVVDTATDGITGEGQTGNYPEEVATRYNSTGGVDNIFVSNSSDGTVSVLNADLSPAGLVDLSLLGGAYPFGLVFGPQGRFLYVSTVNAGEIFVIDTEPGATFLDVVDTFHLPAWFNGRMAIDGGKLIVAGTDLALGAVLTIVDLSNPTLIDTVLLEGHLATWASANDVAVVDGFAYVPVLDYNSSKFLYEVDLGLAPPAVTRAIPLSPLSFSLLEHGIAASPDGNTLVVTSLDGMVQIVCRKTGSLLAEVDLTTIGSGGGNEALFSKDGKKVYITDVYDSLVYVLSGVPEHGLYLDGPDSAPLGGQVTLAVTGGEAGGRGALLASLKSGSIQMPRFILDLGMPVYTLHQGLFDGANSLPLPYWTIPTAWGGLVGATIHLQALAEDGDGEVRPSNTLEILIL
jgi:DNA-binding beta-propeller fold protein YncE